MGQRDEVSSSKRRSSSAPAYAPVKAEPLDVAGQELVVPPPLFILRQLHLLHGLIEAFALFRGDAYRLLEVSHVALQRTHVVFAAEPSRGRMSGDHPVPVQR